MTFYTLDTAAAKKKLEDASCDPVLAEAIVSIVSESQEEVATKSDLALLEERLIGRIDGLDSKFTAEIDRLDTKFTAEIDKLTGKIDGLDAKFTAEINGLDEKLTGKVESLKNYLLFRLVIAQFASIGLFLGLMKILE